MGVREGLVLVEKHDSSARTMSGGKSTPSGVLQEAIATH